MDYRVTVERNKLKFAAAHMATFLGDCEPLHGHIYDLIFELEGDLTDDSWVWDFGDLKRATKAIADELDHRFLQQPRVAAHGHMVRAAERERAAE